jgi:hypothetical protein
MFCTPLSLLWYVNETPKKPNHSNLPWILFSLSHTWMLHAFGRRCYELWPEVLPAARCFEVGATKVRQRCYRGRPRVLPMEVVGATMADRRGYKGLAATAKGHWLYYKWALALL